MKATIDPHENYMDLYIVINGNDTFEDRYDKKTAKDLPEKLIELACLVNKWLDPEWDYEWMVGDPPEDGDYIVTANTDEGKIVTSMFFDGEKWIFGGEPTYCHTYYIEVIKWQRFPDPSEE